MLCHVQSSHARAEQNGTEALSEATTVCCKAIKDDGHKTNVWCSNTVVEIR